MHYSVKYVTSVKSGKKNRTTRLLLRLYYIGRTIEVSLICLWKREIERIIELVPPVTIKKKKKAQALKDSSKLHAVLFL